MVGDGPMITEPDASTIAARRQQLRECIAKMADAIAAGACDPVDVELQALVQICEEHFLPVEAARVRRWMGP